MNCFIDLCIKAPFNTRHIRRHSSNLFAIYAFFILICLCHNENDCLLLRVFRGAPNTIRSVEGIEKICGEFISENMKNSKGKFSLDSSFTDPKKKLNESSLCLYKFIGKKNEKVLINFDSFEIKSLAPDCINEYIDVYIEVTDRTVDNFFETNFLSRFCGWKKPSVLVSYNNIIIFAYHTDGNVRGSAFSGSFKFVDAEPYNLGKKSKVNCEYEFKSEEINSGTFLSPTYPGTYPNKLNCTYRFIGQPDERLSIYFEEILLHYGADHCPYDVLKLYDYQRVGFSSQPNANFLKKFQHSQRTPKYERVLMDAYCGRKINFTLFSTTNLFDIEFEMFDSLGNDEYSEDENKILLRKGFKAHFKFSKYYADLSFITGSHITGTNCDQRIISLPEPTGLIYSPNYFRTQPINATCRYIFEGLNDKFNFESIKLHFYLIEVKPTTNKHICSDNYVTNFVAYGSDKHESKYCFDFLAKEPKELKSSGSQMTLVFNSMIVDQYTPSNFKASYTFYTEFGIQGTRVYQNKTCLYTYNNENVIQGSLNSPRYPQSYPLNLRCDYIFDTDPSKNERILFQFKDFRIPGINNQCKPTADHLAVYSLVEDDEPKTTAISHRNQKFRKRSSENWVLLFRLCGFTTPSPFITDEFTRKFKFTFYSDSINYAQGFDLSYNYVRLPECKYEILTNQNLTSGKIVIGNDIAGVYYCDWYLKTDNDKSLLLSFQNQDISNLKDLFIRIKARSFYLNKNKNEDDFGINQFVVRVFDLNENITEPKYAPKYEYNLEKVTKYFQIDSSNIRIQLVIAKNMVMNGKLLINWITATKNKPCMDDEFLCSQSQYCIKLIHYCDRVEHCPNDFSDEPEKCFVKPKASQIFPPMMQITSFAISILVLVLFLSICIICRVQTAKKKTKIKKTPQFAGPPIYYRYSPANSMDYLEAAITSV